MACPSFAHVKNLAAEVARLKEELSKTAKVTVANAAKYGAGLQKVSQEKVRRGGGWYFPLPPCAHDGERVLLSFPSCLQSGQKSRWSSMPS